MRGIKTIGRFFSILLTALLACLLACNVYLLAVRVITGDQQPTVFGFSAAIVISGSMSSTIEVNDMIIIREQDDYKVNDIITFESGNNLVTHRIVEKTADGYMTKGDANNTIDQQVVIPEQVVGQVIFIIPRIGQFIEYLKTPLGMTILVFIGLLIIEIPALVDRYTENKGGNSHDK